jgi:hypothetical protein
MKIIKLGTKTRDKATGLKGMLTHYQVEMDHRAFYLFQPEGLNPEDGQPVKRLWLVPERLVDQVATQEVELPLAVLGTEVRDAASGFEGTAIALCLHISGCVHVGVQPKGALRKTGGAVDNCDFDIRRLEGKAIKKITEAQRDTDQKQKPSPSSVPACGPRMPS